MDDLFKKDFAFDIWYGSTRALLPLRLGWPSEMSLN